MLVMLVFWYDDFQHGLAIDFPFFGGVGHFGLAVHFGGGLDHVNFLVGSDSGDDAVVFDANEQPSAIGVGKSGQRPGNAPTVGNLKLEVEHLVFAFRNEVLDMVVFLSHRVGKDTDFSNAERPILIRCCKKAIKMGLRLSKKVEWGRPTKTAFSGSLNGFGFGMNVELFWKGKTPNSQCFKTDI